MLSVCMVLTCRYLPIPEVRAALEPPLEGATPAINEASATAPPAMAMEMEPSSAPPALSVAAAPARAPSVSETDARWSGSGVKTRL